MEDNELNEDFAKMFEDALERIKIRENSKLLNFVQELDSLKKQRIQLEASKIYAKKEVEAIEENDSNKDQEFNKESISNEIYELHSGLINHQLIHNLAQKMTDNLRIQDAVFTSLNSMDVDETVDHFPERGEILSQYSQNLDVSQKLTKVIDEKTQLDTDILKNRIKYCNVLKQLKEKWICIEKKSTGEYAGENEAPEVQRIREKLEGRDKKVRVLATMLQSLITCTGIDWGRNKRFIQVLILCDSALSLSKQKNLEDDIKTLENLRLQESDDPRTRQGPSKRSHDDSGTERKKRISDYLVRKPSN
ncbi:unnamed protein product [Meganyctiphanes norvegica]|uniref:Centromere protein H C-terminal domain-containing protein n=1 Tax=Meganyctiphanes norvegica TaxID=48144 RepID=A0AAV2QDI1_MEGNR